MFKTMAYASPRCNRRKQVSKRWSPMPPISTKRIISESSRKNITKTKTKRIISESLRKNITKTKTIRIISERNISSIETPSSYHLWGIVWAIVTGNDVTGSCITGNDVTGSCITGNDVTGNDVKGTGSREPEMKGK